MCSEFIENLLILKYCPADSVVDISSCCIKHGLYFCKSFFVLKQYSFRSEIGVESGKLLHSREMFQRVHNGT